MCAKKFHPFFILAGIALFIGVIGLVASLTLYVLKTMAPIDYGIVLDAGSSHTTLYVYEWEGSKYRGTGMVNQTHSCDVDDDGVGSHASHPSRAGPALRPCIEEAARKIPEADRSSTPIYLGATAGLRLISAQNQTVADQLLKSIRDELGKSAFKFEDVQRQARVISGAEEGSFGWITLNYLLGNLVYKGGTQTKFDLEVDPSSMDTMGALDLGGASTQISFLPASNTKIPGKFSKELALFGNDFSMYTSSFLCYGKGQMELKFKTILLRNASFAATINNPCQPIGSKLELAFDDIFQSPCTTPTKDELNQHGSKKFTFIGKADNQKCAESVLSLFNFNNCSYDRCSFNNVYQPEIRGQFAAFSAFYYVTAFLNLTQKGSFTLDELKQATQTLCDSPWSVVQHMNTKKKKSLPEYCLDSHYIITILTRAYGFTDKTWDNLLFRRKINNSDVGWTLGFMIHATNELAASSPAALINFTLFIIILILSILFLFCGVALCFLACHKLKHSGTMATTKNGNYIIAGKNDNAESVLPLNNKNSNNLEPINDSDALPV